MKIKIKFKILIKPKPQVLLKDKINKIILMIKNKLGIRASKRCLNCGFNYDPDGYFEMGSNPDLPQEGYCKFCKNIPKIKKWTNEK